MPHASHYEVYESQSFSCNLENVSDDILISMFYYGFSSVECCTEVFSHLSVRN